MKKLIFKAAILFQFFGVFGALSGHDAYAQQGCSAVFSETLPQSERLRFNAPKDFINFEKLRSLFGGLLIEDIKFEGPTLSKVQLQALVKFSKNANKPLKKGDMVRIISYSELNETVNTSIGIQHTAENGLFEQRLLAESGVDTKPREVLTFRIFYKDGTSIETPILIKGDINSVNFDEGESQLLNFLRGSSSEIHVVEIAHTHPTYSVLIKSQDGSSKLRSNEISEGDMQTTLNFARKFPPGIGIAIKAILPNGFHYVTAIKSGR